MADKYIVSAYNPLTHLMLECKKEKPNLKNLSKNTLQNVNIRGYFGKTALHYLFCEKRKYAFGHPGRKLMKDSLRKLIKVGKANVNIKDNSGRTPLFYAAQKGYPYCVNLLLRAGANPRIKDDNYQTTLSYILHFPREVYLQDDMEYYEEIIECANILTSITNLDDKDIYCRNAKDWSKINKHDLEGF